MSAGTHLSWEHKPGTMEEKTIKQDARESSPISPQNAVEQGQTEKKTLWQRVKEPGSVWQIIIAALLAIIIGLAVTTSVEEVPEAAIALLAIPGDLWLRALRAVGESTIAFNPCRR